jgi:predicted RNase H-like HicB family nuclease
MTRKYAVIFEQAEANWAAYVPDLPGCIMTGKTLEETERNIREAIEGHLRTLEEFGEGVRQQG